MRAVVDNDGDGFTNADGDCDDTNPNIHPNAWRSADVDQNCNGDNDFDQDADGFKT